MGGRQSCAGKIVKRKDLSQMSIHNQSHISTFEHAADYNVSDDLKQYPMGDMLLREEEMQNNSMLHGTNASSSMYGVGHRNSNG